MKNGIIFGRLHPIRMLSFDLRIQRLVWFSGEERAILLHGFRKTGCGWRIKVLRPGQVKKAVSNICRTGDAGIHMSALLKAMMPGWLFIGGMRRSVLMIICGGKIQRPVEPVGLMNIIIFILINWRLDMFPGKQGR